MKIQKSARPIISKVNMTPLQLARYSSIYPRFKERTINFLTVVGARGQNSFENACSKADALNQRTGKDRDYDRALIDAFQQGVPFNESEIASKVCLIRSHFGHPRMKGNINKECIAELKRVFIFDESMSETPAAESGKIRRNRVYKPVFSLLAE